MSSFGHERRTNPFVGDRVLAARLGGFGAVTRAARPRAPAR
jgi:hypothetical protein